MSLTLLSLFLLVVLTFLTSPSHATLTSLKQRIQAASEAESPSSSSSSSPSSNDLESRVNHILESTSVLHGVQTQLASVTRSMDEFLNQHASQSSSVALDHEKLANLTDTLQRLLMSQRELDERHTRQLEMDHANLAELLEQQQKQQKRLQEEVEHSQALEGELSRLKEVQDAEVNQRMAAQELENSSTAGAQYDDSAESFMEIGAHQEHDVDLTHTINFDTLSPLEVEEQQMLERESALGHAAADADNSNIDSSVYAGSSDYLDAINSAEHAEDMTPEQQMREFGPDAEVGTPKKGGVHSLSEIDSLVAEGESENSAADDFTLDTTNLHNPSLQHDLASLQDEDAIQTAMLHAQAKIKAISEELEKHQSESQHPDVADNEQQLLEAAASTDEPPHQDSSPSETESIAA